MGGAGRAFRKSRQRNKRHKIAEFHLQVWSVEVPLVFPFVFHFDCFFLFTFLPVPFLCSALFIFLFPFLVLVLFILFLFMYFEACLNPPPLVGLWSHKVHAKSCKRVWVWGVKHYQHKLKAGGHPPYHWWITKEEARDTTVPGCQSTQLECQILGYREEGLTLAH